MKKINKTIINKYGHKRFICLLNRLNIQYTRFDNGSYTINDSELKKLHNALGGKRKNKRKNIKRNRKLNPLGLSTGNERIFSGENVIPYKR